MSAWTPEFGDVPNASLEGPNANLEGPDTNL